MHEGPARVFDCEEDAMAAIYAGKIEAGDVVVIRYEGPKGGPGMREMLNPTSAIAGMGLDKDRGPDHRRPFLRRHPRRVHRPRVPGGRCRRPHRPGAGGRHHCHRYSQPFDLCESERRRSSPAARQTGSVPSRRSKPDIWPGMQKWSLLQTGEPFWSNETFFAHRQI